MTFDIIASGSKGNAAVLNGNILIDCGVPFRKLKGVYKGLSLAVLTHIHGDHFNVGAIKQLHFLRPTLRFLCPPWLYEPLRVLGVSGGVIDVAKEGEILHYQKRKTFEMSPVPHDVPNCAWHIYLDGESAFYATDCGSLDGVTAPGYDLYLIEANYKEAEIQERMQRKLNDGKFAHESRVMETHLSREQAEAWLAVNAEAGKSKVVYIHQHEADDKGEESNGRS